jgi:peptidoglycan/LPS O-acetylase OafA/YrhL
MVAMESSKRSFYIPSLDGWRAIAIFWVLMGHSKPWTVGPLSNYWLIGTDSRGVQLFFALSGFLICTRMLREEERVGSISLRSFYTRRLFRIQPAALAYLFVIVVLNLTGVVPHFWPGVVAAVLMIRNIWPLALKPGYWYTAHFWSLAVEEHFYLLLPGFLILFRRSRLTIMLGAELTLEIWRIVVLNSPRLQTGLSWQLIQRTDMAIEGILVGSVFAIALTNVRLMRFAMLYLRPWVAVLYTAFAFVEVQRHHSSWMKMSLIPVYPVLIVATAVHPKAILTRLLELSPVRFVGRISYSLYIWQELFTNADATPALHFLYSHVLLSWCASFASAMASYYLIETPLIRYGHKIAKRFDVRPGPPSLPAVLAGSAQ